MLVHHVRKLARSLQKKRLKRNFDRSNRGLSRDFMALSNGATIKAHPDSRHDFEYFCFRDPPVAEEFRSFAFHTTGRKRLLDIGAMDGFFSLAFTALDSDRRAIAVDLDSKAIERLAYHVNANNLASQVTIEHIGLSNSESENITTGDSLCSRHSFQPDAIKIDVEGHESKVLHGLRETIARFQPVLFIEIHPEMIAKQGDSLSGILAQIEDLDYFPIETNGRKMRPGKFVALTAVTRLVLLRR